MFKPYVTVGSFVFVVVLITAFVVFVLRSLEPDTISFSLAGIIVRINDRAIGVRLYSGVIVFVYNIENLHEYEEFLRILHEEETPAEICLSKVTCRFSKKTTMSIVCVSVDFSQPAERILPRVETEKRGNGQ
jgi:hypothetical protein